MKNTGIRIGMEQGREEGKQDKQLEIAEALLKNKVEIDIIIDSTGLSKEEIEKLR
jgi:predicted transposase/invertase (TIGR01784 family)